MIENIKTYYSNVIDKIAEYPKVAFWVIAILIVGVVIF